MRYTTFLIGFVLLFVVAGRPAEAAARRATPLKQAAAKKTTKAKRKAVVTKKGTSTRSRRAAAPKRPARQSEPTPERYIEIQQALIDKGLHPGPATGKWGSEWATVLKEFQQSQNLKPDGKLGALSLIALGLGPKRDPVAQATGRPETMP